MKKVNIDNFRLFHSIISCSVFTLTVLAFLLTGCLAGIDPKKAQNCEELPALDNGGRLSVFVNLEEPGAQHVNISLSLIEVLINDQWMPLSGNAVEIDTQKLGKAQAFAGSRVIPSGKYDRLRVTVSKASKIINNKKFDLSIEKNLVDVSLSIPLEVGFQESGVIFLAWDSEAVLDMSRLNPVIFRASHSQVAHVASNKIYVSCPDIDNIYIVRADKNWVQGALAISGRPTFMVSDSVNKKLYILAEEEVKIKIVDLNSLLVVEEIKIPMTRKPVFMTMMPDFTSAFIIDDMNNVVKMDITNGLMVARKRIGQRPIYAAYLSSQDKVAISSTYDKSVYFINPDTLDTLETVTVAGSPNGLLEWENYLYIAEDDSNRVSLFDLNERRIEKSISVGYSPSRLVSIGNSIYLSNKLDPSISFLKGGQFFASKTLSVSGSTAEMAVADNHRLLYVSNGGCDGNLAVIDLTSNRHIGKIDLGAKPYGVAVIQ